MIDINKKIIKGVLPSVEMVLSELDDPTLDERTKIVEEKVNLYIKEFVPKRKHSKVNIEQIVSTVIISTCKWISKVQVISDPTNHQAWLNSDRKENWPYWDSYQEYLEDFLDDDSIDNLDDSTDKVIEQLEDPKRLGSWDRRGLVVGHVQSGKTGHYNGVIAKAADAGYKIIIVLAGLHNNLRAQTQLRLEAGFLGFETDFEGATGRLVGVGKLRDSSIKPNTATNRSEKGDFNKPKAKSIQSISPEEKPWLFVVKKNKSVLEHLLKWIQNRVADSEETDSRRPIVTELPLLIIDDEADNASVDTKEQVYGGEGEVDDEHNPTTINSLIRQVLHTFSRKAYIGYTATPFANVFIHNKNETHKEGKDLFPNSFIINLTSPSNYVGPSTVFSDKGIQLFTRTVDDNIDEPETSVGWMPNKHKSFHIPVYQGESKLPPSLEEAINSFLLACCVRSCRGDDSEHWSMLIHVTRYNNVQSIVVDQVNEYIKLIEQRLLRGIGKAGILDTFRALWERDFKKVTNALLPEDDLETKEFSIKNYYISALPNWTTIEEKLPRILNEIKVMTINGQAKEALAYEEYKEIGLKVIAVGGDKLSRGLTLEGLMTSYFLRASKMYDTLMQMGRWFGYRSRYLDLCRLYTTDDLVEWFSRIAEASEELREEFDLMVRDNLKPHEFGLKVQSHPSLLVTSPLKMRTAKTFKLSFSGDTSETVAFNPAMSVIDNNRAALNKLVDDISDRLVTPATYEYTVDRTSLNGLLFKDVDASQIITFLRKYETHKDSYKSNSRLLANFIEKMNGCGELTEWTVAILGGEGKKQFQFLGHQLNATRRAYLGTSDPGRVSIRRLLDPKHELIGITASQYDEAFAQTLAVWEKSGMESKEPTLPRNTIVRDVRGRGATPERHKGLILIYLLEIRKKDEISSQVNELIPAFGISFPASDSGIKVPYVVNNVMQEEWGMEYGGSE